MLNPVEMGEVQGRIKRINKTAGRDVLAYNEKTERIERVRLSAELDGEGGLSTTENKFDAVRFYLVGVQVGILEGGAK